MQPSNEPNLIKFELYIKNKIINNYIPTLRFLSQKINPKVIPKHTFKNKKI